MTNTTPSTRAANVALYPHNYRNRRAQRAFLEASHGLIPWDRPQPYADRRERRMDAVGAVRDSRISSVNRGVRMHYIAAVEAGTQPPPAQSVITASTRLCCAAWLAPIVGETPEETRRLKNAAKRERQARRGAR